MSNQVGKRPTKAIVLPGNGVPSHFTSIDGFGFYSEVAELLNSFGVATKLPAFPEGEVGYEDVWKRFAVDELHLDDTTILVGHSTGAVCAMRLMEEHKTAGVVLVAAYHSDLGDETERESGYFGRPWDWEAMKRNTPWIMQFHSQDDYLVPVEEARFVAQHCGSEFHLATKEGHYSQPSRFLVQTLKAKLDTVVGTPSQ